MVGSFCSYIGKERLTCGWQLLIFEGKADLLWLAASDV